ncbi:MAG: PEGA domain-containing protein [Planctomycetes bacterium]|nr:PEGA domain-containing protein [Planctomycetota bacterium]
MTLLLATTPGCVTRTLFVRSDPPGARVLLDGKAVGTTPYTEVFQSYGVRRLELRLEGHRRLVAELDIVRPWWQYLPFALITDVLWPFPIHDERTFEFALEPLDPDAATFGDAQAAYERMLRHKERVTGRGEPADAARDAPDDGTRP